MMMIMVVNLIAGRANPAGRMDRVNANPKGTLSWQQSSKEADDRRESEKTSTFASADISLEFFYLRHRIWAIFEIMISPDHVLYHIPRIFDNFGK